MKKNEKKSVNRMIYIVSAFMILTVIVLGIISGVGMNITRDEDIIDHTEDDTLDSTDDTNKPATDTTETEKPKETETRTPPNTEDPSSEATAAPVDFCLPVTGYISKEYSMDMPVYSLTMNDYRAHSGVDIQTSVGSAVAAIAEGTVTDRYTDPFMGVCVEVTHGGGLVSRYMNLGEEFPADAEVGCKVYCGQTIACVGDSAAAEAADSDHLHLELLKDGNHVDPIEYIGFVPLEDEGYEE